jgi:hypothetical protein
MASTLLLDRTVWDLVLDASGNIALASDPYSIAQDVASAIKLFKGELWFDATSGIPYWEQILGQLPPLSVIKSQVEAAALTVPEVASATCLIVSFVDRQITGQVQVTNSSGTTQTVSF